MTISWILMAVTIVCVVIAAFCDKKTYKIPNWLTLSMMGVGLIMSIIVYPVQLIPKGICLIAFFVIWMFKLTSAGDAKLMMGICLLEGATTSIVATILGAIIMLIVCLIKDYKDTKERINTGIFSIFTKQYSMAAEGGKKLPFAPYIAIGLVITEIGRIILWLTR